MKPDVLSGLSFEYVSFKLFKKKKKRKKFIDPHIFTPRKYISQKMF